MRLNMASDYALRVLMLLSQLREPITIDDITEKLDIPKSHVMKIAAKLNSHGYLKSIRGRTGGVSLARDCRDINIGDVVRLTEADFAVVECLKSDKCSCRFASGCALTPIMKSATEAFIAHLNQYTLQNVVDKSPGLRGIG